MKFPYFRQKILTAVIVSVSTSTILPTFLLAEDLGTISVQSTTIDDRFENKRDEVSSIGIISSKEIDKDHPQNVQDMLRRIPGITTEVQNGDSLKIHIRGVENQVFMGERPGVAIVIDGVPVFERTGRVNIDLDNIESIKVIKGGASYLFGDDALAGAVIITTKRGADNAGYRVDLETGSFGSKKALLQAGFENEQANGHLQISRRETDGYYEDSGSKADYLNGKLQYYIDDSSDLTLGMEISDREKGSHGTVTGKTAAENDPKSKNTVAYNDYANNYDVDLQKFFATYSKDFNETSNLMLNVYQYSDETKYDSSPLDSDPTRYAYDNDYDQTQRGLKSEYRTDGTTFAWMAGLDIRDNEYKDEVIVQNNDELWGRPPPANGSIYSDSSTDEDVMAFYGELKYKATDKLILTLNGRNDNIDLDYKDKLDNSMSDKTDFNESSFRLGGNYALQNNIDIYTSASSGFRTPTVSQLFLGSDRPGRQIAANPDLEAETSLNLEIGVRMNTSLFDIDHDFDVSIFELTRDDHIQATAGQYTTGADNIYDNIGDVRNRGLELAINSDIRKMVSWDIAYTYLNAKYAKYDNFNLQTEPVNGICVSPGSTPVYGRGGVTNCLTAYDNEGNYIPRTPDHALNAIVRVRPAQHWTISTEMQAQSSYYVDEINQEKIGGRAIFNIWANYDRKIGNADWSFFARIDNLFDRYYYNTARGYRDSNYVSPEQPDGDGYYNEEDLSIVVNPGIVFSAGLSVRF
ncbi:MAG: TonB-dependent receptor [gamma proteobacterium symbiont of Taylorina sp.]|nr:TonB-dependent receptor [gamma proteobacterium symbiont of Taylorina sp.]